MFACDQLHTSNIACMNLYLQVYVSYFTILSKSINNMSSCIYAYTYTINSCGVNTHMKSKWMMASMLSFFFVSFWINMMGLMKMYPIYITSPLLFLSLFILVYYFSIKNKFRGFK
ncbi:hypothetical protein D9X91_03235 [Falsibacillus albus]|uniref:Uncharacterized protein n=1 Tax=Falsibacillus albus TaxID=2478915 RepID=A0A3L7K2Y7_9BACI|nr:hypothetical protein D9X91_03235 [Falsibacillus albus]